MLISVLLSFAGWILSISISLWKGQSIFLVLSIKTTLEQASAAIIDLCVLWLPASIEQTEWPAESRLSSSPGSLLSLTASTDKHLSWDKSNIARGEAHLNGRVNFVPGEMKLSSNWDSVAIDQFKIQLLSGCLVSTFISRLNDCACYSGAFVQVY